MHQAAGLQQAGRAQGRLAHQQTRAEADAAGELVGLVGERRADFKCGIADGEPGARLDVEPRQQSRIGGGAEDAIALGQRIGERAGRIERDRAEQRIGAVDRFELDQCRLAVGAARHGAQGRGARHACRGS